MPSCPTPVTAPLCAFKWHQEEQSACPPVDMSTSRHVHQWALTWACFKNMGSRIFTLRVQAISKTLLSSEFAAYHMQPTAIGLRHLVPRDFLGIVMEGRSRLWGKLGCEFTSLGKPWIAESLERAGASGMPRRDPTLEVAWWGSISNSASPRLGVWNVC